MKGFFLFAFLIGIFSYVIFFLGIFHVLYDTTVVALTSLLIIFYFFLSRNWIFKIPQEMGLFWRSIIRNKLHLVLFLILLLQIFVNLIGALGPELAFDALWYHLTLPKLYLQHHAINFIPGGLLYYSVMPKLAEMLYIPALTFGSEMYAKLIHFSFGILTIFVMYNMVSERMSKFTALLAVVIFYANLVVAWESTTAYVDLVWTFYSLMALWGFLKWEEIKKKKWLLIASVMTGFAITTKLLAVGSLIILVMLILFKNEKLSVKLKQSILFVIVSLLIPLPWFIFSYINTGSPVYPFFTYIYSANYSVLLLNPQTIIIDFVTLFFHSADPISPIYAVVFPLVIIHWKKLFKSERTILLYGFIALVVWYFTPRTGGGRFIVPYLPVLSIIVADVILFQSTIKKCLFLLVMFISMTSIGYRTFTNAKYLPVILGFESKKHFLSNHLNFSYGDYLDVDNYMKEHITKKDMVLLFGFHNLYYVDFPFIDSSWVKKGDRFSYIAMQNIESFPSRFSPAKLVYYNPVTHVKLYRVQSTVWND